MTEAAETFRKSCDLAREVLDNAVGACVIASTPGALRSSVSTTRDDACDSLEIVWVKIFEGLSVYKDGPDHFAPPRGKETPENRMEKPHNRQIKGFFDELIDRFGREDFASKIGVLEDKREKEFNDLLRALDKSQIEKLRELTEKRRSLVSTDAAYGNEIIAISKQILAFGGAGIGLAAAFASRLAELPTELIKAIGVLTIFYVNLVLLSLVIIFLFAWQARFRYPFLYLRKIGNTIPFFYYRAISHATPRTFFQTAEQKLFATELYGADLIKFVTHLLPEKPRLITPSALVLGEKIPSPEEEAALETDRQRLRDELQQYFLIVAYQGYVNQYEVKMNNIFLYGLLGSTGAALLSAVWVLLK